MALEYGVPMEKASLLIGFMSVASTFGRLFFGKIADSHYVNRLYMYQISMLGMGSYSFLYLQLFFIITYPFFNYER